MTGNENCIKINQKLTLISCDGLQKIELGEDEICKQIDLHFRGLQQELYLMLKGTMAGTPFFNRTAFGLPTNDEIMAYLRVLATEHNQKVIRELITLHNHIMKRERERLTQLAKEFNVKIEWDTGELSIPEREISEDHK
ncbi:MAG: hypothetical protein Q8P07_03260 [bacterium]|nr:hypothetical protein [bacterium]